MERRADRRHANAASKEVTDLLDRDWNRRAWASYGRTTVLPLAIIAPSEGRPRSRQARDCASFMRRIIQVGGAIYMMVRRRR